MREFPQEVAIVLNTHFEPCLDAVEVTVSGGCPNTEIGSKGTHGQILLSW
jgi:hypothetical protein